MTPPRKLPLFPMALLGSIIAGLVLGWAFPRGVYAANFWEFWHDISVGSTSGQTVLMNCGWHGQCGDNPTYGSALDWEETNTSAYLAGAAKWTDWWVENAAYAYVYYSATPTCKRVVADIYNWWNDNYLATEYYTHVQRNGSTTIQIYAWENPWAIREPVGTVATSELSGCQGILWDGSHVHQYGSGFSATNNGPSNWDPFPDWPSCYWPACWSTSNQTWMHYESWTY